MWSSQRYRLGAEEYGLSKATIEAAIAQTKAVIEGPHRLPAVLTLGHLAQRTGVSYSVLRELVTGTYGHPYRHFSIRKRSSGKRKTVRYRKISVPAPDLYRVQRWVAAHVLRPVPAHEASKAFSPDSSIVKCAEKHCGAKWSESPRVL